MNLSSSSSQYQSKDQKNCTNTTSNEAKKSAPHCVMLAPFSSPPLNFFQTFPFLKQPSHVKPSFELLSTATSQAFDQLQSSIASTTDKWFIQLHDFASHNPILEKLLSFSSQLQSSSQIAFRNNRNLDNLSHHNFAAVLPGDSLAGLVVANGIVNFLNIYNSLLVVRLVLTWFPNAPPVIVSPLSTLCDPYLNIFRGIIPPLGGSLDLSPILAFLLLNVFTSTASAIPAELPPAGVSQDGSLQTTGSRATTTQKKWMRRLAANQKSSSC